MKTNFVKKGSERNIEMFKMSNDELFSVTGGAMVPLVVRNEDGDLVVVWVNRAGNANNSIYSREM